MSEHEHKHEVRIHIDQKAHQSSNPTTGHALYELGRVAPGMQLFREVTGNKEDRAIFNDPETVHLKEDDHFHSGPEVAFVIVVNGQQKTVKGKKEVSYWDLVHLAFDPVPTGPNIMFSITYEDGPHANPVGSLVEGASVKIKDGMIFNVTPTDKS